MRKAPLHPSCTLRPCRRCTISAIGDATSRVSASGRHSTSGSEVHYIPAKSNAWGGAGETLEDAIADFSLSQLASRVGDSGTAKTFLERAQYWKNLMNEQGYLQNRNEDGTWPPFDPCLVAGFRGGIERTVHVDGPIQCARPLRRDGRRREGRRAARSALSQPGRQLGADAHGRDARGARQRAVDRRALAVSLFGRPYKTQSTVREAMNELWSDRPYGLPGNDDLGAMSAWFVWSAMGMYPGIPGRAELLLGSPLFPRIVIYRANGVTITVTAPQARAGAPYVQKSDKGRWKGVDAAVVTRSIRPLRRDPRILTRNDAEHHMGRPTGRCAAASFDGKRRVNHGRSFRASCPARDRWRLAAAASPYSGAMNRFSGKCTVLQHLGVDRRGVVQIQAEARRGTAGAGCGRG